MQCRFKTGKSCSRQGRSAPSRVIRFPAALPPVSKNAEDSEQVSDEMSRKDYLITKIVNLEWDMFQNVRGIGGRASCQEDHATFRINRVSQAQSWSEPALESYLEDLENAKKKGRNLLSEKYGHMMASTSISEYESIKHLLPAVEDGIPSLVEKIVNIVIDWEQEMVKKYPHLVQRGRPIYSSQDSPYVTSLETYLRGELLTYSKRTLELLHENYHNQKTGNINGSEIILEHMIKQYGYTSLEQANIRMRKLT